MLHPLWIRWSLEMLITVGALPLPGGPDARLALDTLAHDPGARRRVAVIGNGNVALDVACRERGLDPAAIDTGALILTGVAVRRSNARAIGDLLLARADGSPQRFYSLSAQIQRERKAYYDILERTQRGSLDVTDWLAWFLGCLLRSIHGAEQTLSSVLMKARYWQQWASVPMNDRQIKLWEIFPAYKRRIQQN